MEAKGERPWCSGAEKAGLRCVAGRRPEPMARRLLLFLGLGLQATSARRQTRKLRERAARTPQVSLLQAQTNEDVAFMQGSPLGCFVRGQVIPRMQVLEAV